MSDLILTSSFPLIVTLIRVHLVTISSKNKSNIYLRKMAKILTNLGIIGFIWSPPPNRIRKTDTLHTKASSLKRAPFFFLQVLKEATEKSSTIINSARLVMYSLRNSSTCPSPCHRRSWVAMSNNTFVFAKSPFIVTSLKSWKAEAPEPLNFAKKSLNFSTSQSELLNLVKWKHYEKFKRVFGWTGRKPFQSFHRLKSPNFFYSFQKLSSFRKCAW